MNLNVEHSTIHVNGIDLHYVSAGSGDSAVVLLHGFPEFWYSWRYQIPVLAETHRVIVPDQRGYNLSSKPQGIESYTVPIILNDLAGLLDKLGIEKATIVGHDWGGMIAWMWAILHPERTERLAVINLPHPALMVRALLLRNPRQILRSWYIWYFQIPRLPEHYLLRNNCAALKAALKLANLSAEDQAMFVEAWQQPGAITAMINWYRAMVRYGLAWQRAIPSLKVTVPTQLIWGTNDNALGQELTYGTEQYVDDLRIRYLNGISHWAQQQAPDLVNAMLVPFVRGEI